MWHNLQSNWTGATKVNRTWFRHQKVLTFFRLMQFAAEQRLNEQDGLIIDCNRGSSWIHTLSAMLLLFLFAKNFGLLTMISASWVRYICKKKNKLELYFQLDKMVRRKLFSKTHNILRENIFCLFSRYNGALQRVLTVSQNIVSCLPRQAR